MKIRDFIKKAFYSIMPKKTCINHIYNNLFNGRKISWNNPLDLNEKIQWLKLYSDTSLWVKCADKYRVRDYVSQCGLSKLLVPLYGVYESADDIDFSVLPDSFVLKVNNGSGDSIIVHDKSIIDEILIKKQLQADLNRKFGLCSTEYHYLEIPPVIIAEKLLVDKTIKPNESLIDYKLWCFDGEPYVFFVVSNRTKNDYQMYLYDLDWNLVEDKLVYSDHSKKGKLGIPKPITLQKMIEAARILSKGIPQVRIDFYEVGGELFFGEMTFTSTGGYMRYFTSDYLLEMGERITLPSKI